MATPRLLNDNDLVLTESNFAPLFSNPDLFKQQLENTRRISTAIQAVGVNPGSNTANGQKIALLTVLDEFANGDLDLIWITYSQPGVLTIQDAGKNYSATIGRSNTNLARYQMKLYDAQPSAVFWSLMGANAITTSLDSSTKTKVIEVLNTAMARNFKIGRDSIDTMMANSAYSASLSTDAVRNFFRKLWRLSVLVKLPQDLSYLWQNNYDSAQQIAHIPRTSFVVAVTAIGMSEESAVAIHDHASMVDLRNEQAWTAMLGARSQWNAAQIAANNPATASSTVSAPKSQLVNYSNIFGDVYSNACADCSSVTGPASYFVDLLRMLKNCPSDPALGPISSNNPSLLEKLFARRPDLRTLHLSCANVNIMIPYVDLANEIMESFAQNLTVAGNTANIPIQVHNMSSDDTSDQCLAQPKETKYTVYSQQVGTRVFPMDIFPYSQAVDTQRCYLEALGSSRYELMLLFGSKYRLQADAYQTGPGAYKQAEAVGKYALAAEYLGLQPDDFVAITSTSVFPVAYYTGTQEAYLTQATYNTRIGLFGTAQYWGFAGDAAMLSESDGLAAVSSVFLPRATLSMQQLLDLLKSRFAGGKLALGNVSDTAVFTTNIADLRLRHPSQTNSRATLTVEDCAALQAFLRLWRKTSWLMGDLDLAVSCLGEYPASAASLPRISADTIAALAAVKELQALTEIPIWRLMPLWGIIDTQGNSSFYAQTFLRGKADGVDAIFGRDAAGCYLSNSAARISEYRGALLAALDIDDAHLDSLLWCAKIADDTLSLSNVTSLYRVALICQILDIIPTEYPAFINMYDKGFSPFKSPQTTLNLVKAWRGYVNSGVSLGQTLFITGNDAILGVGGSGYGASDQRSYEATLGILHGLMAIDLQVPVGQSITPSTASAGEVARIANMMFDPTTAPGVIDFIERTTASPFTSSSPVYQDVLMPFFTDSTSEAQSIFFGQAQPVGTSEDIATVLETQAQNRRSLFLKGISPALKSRQVKDVVLNSMSSLLPDVDPALLRLLLVKVIRNGSTTAGDVLGGLLTANTAATNATGSFYFSPPSTESYRFLLPTAYGLAPRMIFEGSPLTFSLKGSNWTTNDLNLTNGQGYALTLSNCYMPAVTYATVRAGASPLTSGVLVAQATLTNARAVFDRITRAANLISQFNLNVEEVKLMQTQESGTPLATDFNALKYKDMRTIQTYATLRGRVSSHGSSLLKYFRWTSQQYRDSSLTEQLSILVGLPSGSVQDYLDAKYPALNLSSRIGLLRDPAEINDLLNASTLLARLGIPGISHASLFKWATPIQPGSSTSEYDIAADLRLVTKNAAVTSRTDDFLSVANGKLREKQRSALVSYLLQQDYMRNGNVLDEGNLFEFLLVDVQMGSGLQTSRLKQAISTVQLYVQRCILGLEKSRGVASGTVDLDRWRWMQRYRLWEANRKVYLYPENWVDPFLRDDKSESFKTLEANVLQTDLNQDAVTDILRSYVYNSHEVASLDILTYAWASRGSYAGKVHFFARSRHSPYSYFYRLFEMTQSEDFTKRYVFWNPWVKIDVEVPSVEVDADSKALPTPGAYLVSTSMGNRLFLFLPQITLKTVTDALPSKTFAAMGNDGVQSAIPARYWQIQMGWTEYRNGKWSPKQLAPAVLNVSGAQQSDWTMRYQTLPAAATWTEAQKFPSITSFKFWASFRNAWIENRMVSILCIEVERFIGPIDGKYLAYPLGRFEMRGQQLVLVDPSTLSELPFKETHPTVFGKQNFRITDNTRTVPPYKVSHGLGSLYSPWIGTVSLLNNPVPRDVRYTMSFDTSFNIYSSGLVQDVLTGDAVTTYFTNVVYSETSRGPSTASQDVLQNLLSPTLMNVTSTYDGMQGVYSTLSSTQGTDAETFFGKRSGEWHELSHPYSVYNWELGCHAIMLLMERLQTTQQFDLALQVARYVFDPTIDGTNLNRCWLFPPFKDIASVKIDSAEDVVRRLAASSGSDSEMNMNILEWRRNPFSPHAVARARPSAYMRRFVMKYIEVLIASGDELFLQNTLETVPLAIQRYVEASQVCGKAPKPIPTLGRSTPQSYADLDLKLNDFGNSQFDMELDFPFYCDPTKRGGVGSNAASSLTGILRTTYFCVPTNPKLIELRSVIDDRLFKIRNCQDINGTSRTLSLFEPVLDPGMITQAISKGVSLTVLLNDTVGPMPNFRLPNLLEKAIEMCNELKSMGAAYLAVRETRDVEALANLQARQENAMQVMTMDTKKLAREEIVKSIAELRETRKGQVSRLRYFLALTGDQSEVPKETSEWEDLSQSIEKPSTDGLRMNSNERLEMNQMAIASSLSVKAIGLDTVASVIKAVPEITTNFEPLGVGTTIGGITANISDAIAMTAGVMRSVAQSQADVGARAARKGELVAQLQERRMEANTAGRDIKVIDRQIETMKTRLSICDEDIRQQHKSMAHATELSEWLRNKYTSEQLYAWLDGQIRTLFYQTYLLANDLAKKAQKLYRYERGSDNTEYVGQSYWNSSRDGMLSGEGLYLALKRMEAAFMDQKGHDFEVKKEISLRQIQPFALLNLRETGSADFGLPEVLFDYDFPGQYMRRIKTISVTMPTSTDIGSGMNATLRLLEHRYRVKPLATSGQDYILKSVDDDRFRTNQIPTTAIAVSENTNDSGIFEHNLEFNDCQRYVPFEGAGCISKWRIELPTAIKTFDYSTITDVKLHIKYTACAGSMALRKAASDAARSFQNSVTGLSSTEGMFAVIDMKSDLPSQWTTLTTSRSVEVSGLANRLPFWTKGRAVRVESITALVSATSNPGWTTNLTLSGNSRVSWQGGTDIGAFKVVLATGLSERFTTWTVGLTPSGASSGVQNIIFVLRYYLA
ncbi:MAG: hypothetical protein Q9216_001796 [Gyalolechia sp. 2 TL-2023]